MGSKTVAISDEIHILLVKTQTEIFEKKRATVRLSDLTNLAIECGIGTVRERYGIAEISKKDSKKPEIVAIEENIGESKIEDYGKPCG